MKALLVLLTVLAVVWLLRSARRGTPPIRDEAPKPPPGQAVQTLRRCAHCGMHLASAADGVVESRDGQPYCSAAHRLAGPRAPFGSR